MSLTNFPRTAQWLHACGKTPSVQHLSTQIGCHFEEFVELLNCIELDSGDDRGSLSVLADELAYIAKGIKSGQVLATIPGELREQALDAFCDGEVTGNGVCYLAGFRKDEADQAVLQANDNKLVDGRPVILPGGKIGKPAGWKPADLSEFV